MNLFFYYLKTANAREYMNLPVTGIAEILT